jgi:predicted AAA+ superfamily ATPase
VYKDCGIAVREALADNRAVPINGARQTGKSTLARVVAGHQAANDLLLEPLPGRRTQDLRR